MKELNGKNLSISSYHMTGKIDILLGANVYGGLLEDGIIRIKSTTILAQNTGLAGFYQTLSIT